MTGFMMGMPIGMGDLMGQEDPGPEPVDRRPAAMVLGRLQHYWDRHCLRGRPALGQIVTCDGDSPFTFVGLPAIVMGYISEIDQARSAGERRIEMDLLLARFIHHSDSEPPALMTFGAPSWAVRLWTDEDTLQLEERRLQAEAGGPPLTPEALDEVLGDPQPAASGSGPWARMQQDTAEAARTLELAELSGAVDQSSLPAAAEAAAVLGHAPVTDEATRPPEAPPVHEHGVDPAAAPFKPWVPLD